MTRAAKRVRDSGSTSPVATPSKRAKRGTRGSAKEDSEEDDSNADVDDAPDENESKVGIEDSEVPNPNKGDEDSNKPKAKSKPDSTAQNKVPDKVTSTNNIQSASVPQQQQQQKQQQQEEEKAKLAQYEKQRQQQQRLIQQQMQQQQKAKEQSVSLCHYPLSGPWISTHTILAEPIILKRPEDNLSSKWGMKVTQESSQWGVDWTVVMISDPGPQNTLCIGDILLGVNGVSLNGKTWDETMRLLANAGMFCHLAVARFQVREGGMTYSAYLHHLQLILILPLVGQGHMMVLVQVPEGVAGGDMLVAKCPDGGQRVEVFVPAGLKAGDKFQMQVKQTQYNTEQSLLAAQAQNKSNAASREKVFKQQQLLCKAHQKQMEEQYRLAAQRQSSVPNTSAPPSVTMLPFAVNQSDPSSVLSGEFTQTELSSLILAVTAHGKNWHAVASSAHAGGGLARRTAADCALKWSQVVACRRKVTDAAVAALKAKVRKSAERFFFTARYVVAPNNSVPFIFIRHRTRRMSKRPPRRSRTRRAARRSALTRTCTRRPGPLRTRRRAGRTRPWLVSPRASGRWSSALRCAAESPGSRVSRPGRRRCSWRSSRRGATFSRR